MAPLFVMALAGTVVHAQTLPTPDAPPSDPLVATAAPAMSQWTIDCVYGASDAPVARGGASAKPTPRLHQEIITKTGETRHDVSVMDDGAVAEKWARGGILAAKDPAYPRISVHVGQPEGAPDFPDFDWLTKSKFAGRQKADNRTYLIFREEQYAFRWENPTMFLAITSTPDGSPSSDIGRKVPIVALIDEESRLPVSLSIGRDARTYHFQPAPTVVLILPADFGTAIGQTLLGIQALTRPLSHP